MRRDGRSGRVRPGVAVRVIDVPMGIDELPDRVRTQAVEGRHYARFGDREPGVDKKLAILASEDGDISAGTFQNADIATQG